MMHLIGMLDSPFVRRVAIAMTAYERRFVREAWSVFGNADKIRAHNPLGRVPTLVIDDDTVLTDSQLILDYLDHQVGAQIALMPDDAELRAEYLAILGQTMGAMDKMVALVYERHQRPQDKYCHDWSARITRQIGNALGWLACHDWILAADIAERPSHAEIAVGVLVKFAEHYLPDVMVSEDYDALRAFSVACEAHAWFRAQPFPEMTPLTWPAATSV